MIKSMTGYGRAEIEFEGTLYVCEIRSVNRRFLEIQFRSEIDIITYENSLRTLIKQQVARGMLEVRFERLIEASSFSQINVEYLDYITKVWNSIADHIHLSQSDAQKFLAKFLISQPDFFKHASSVSQIAPSVETVQQVLQLAIEKLISMKVCEGLEIKEEFLRRIQKIESWVQEIAKWSSQLGKTYQQKIMDRLQNALQIDIQEEQLLQRIAQEVAIFVDRSDISEEICRIQAHIAHFLQLLELENSEGIGKTLEFLVQEIHREANTIGSKANHVEISALAVSIKSELEKIREQVQNIE